VKINNFDIKILPAKCPTPKFAITIEARTQIPLKDVIKIIAIKYPPSKVNYSQQHNSITLRAFNRMIGIYSNGLITFCAEDITEGKKVLEKIKQIIEDALIDVATLGPPNIDEIEKWSKLTPLELYNYLPKLNCKECGELSCMALAIKVLSGEKKLEECKKLKDPKYKKYLSMMRKIYGDRIIRSLGWIE